MPRWKTDEIVKLVSAVDAKSIGKIKVRKQGQGGDCDTSNLIVEVQGHEDRLFVSGFHTGEDIQNPDDCEVEMVEVKDGLDSSGGLSSEDEAIGILYVRVRKALIGAGFDVVASMDEYF